MWNALTFSFSPHTEFTKGTLQIWTPRLRVVVWLAQVTRPAVPPSLTHIAHHNLSHNIPWLCPDDVKKQLGFSQIDYGALPLRNVPKRTHYTGMYSLAPETWRPSCRRWPSLLSSCRSCSSQKPQKLLLAEAAFPFERPIGWTVI